MGYLDFLPYWFAANALPPVIAFLGTTGSLARRTHNFLVMVLLAIAFLALGWGLGYVSVIRGWTAGVLFAIFGMPAAAIVLTVVAVTSDNRKHARRGLESGAPEIDP